MWYQDRTDTDSRTISTGSHCQLNQRLEKEMRGRERGGGEDDKSKGEWNEEDATLTLSASTIGWALLILCTSFRQLYGQRGHRPVTSDTHTCTHTRMHMHAHTHARARTRTRTRTHTHACTCTHTTGPTLSLSTGGESSWQYSSATGERVLTSSHTCRD